MESKMNLVIRLVYRGKEMNLGGNMCIQQAECMHPFREKLRRKWDQLLEKEGQRRRGIGEPAHREVW